MLDASGKLNDGMLQLNTMFLGSSKECIEIDVHRPGNNLDSFKGKYIIVGIAGSKSSKERMERMPIFIDGQFLQLGASVFVKYSFLKLLLTVVLQKYFLGQSLGVCANWFMSARLMFR